MSEESKNCKELAEQAGVELARVLEITGHTHWNNAVSDEDIESVLEETSNDERVKEPEPKAPKGEKLPGYLARRQKQIAEAKARAGKADGRPSVGNDYQAEQYKGERDKLPGRIRRNLERQENQ